MKARHSDPTPKLERDSGLPLIWVLMGHRVGDNLQVQSLARELPWPQEARELKWHEPLARWTPFYARASTLKYLTDDAKKAFAPPWPDIVFSIGWRSVPVARWIRDQSGARLVHLGRPRAPLGDFDLVLTTPQYRLPEAKNVVRLDGPLSTQSPGALAKSAAEWGSRLEHLPKPWIAVLLGGDAKPLQFAAETATRMALECNALAIQRKGSLLIATSPRTSQPATEAFMSCINVPHFCYRWDDGDDNPYSAFIGLADEFIVTNDSISMASEAMQTKRPLHLFALPYAEAWPARFFRWVDRQMVENDSAITRCYRDLVRQGILTPLKAPGDYHKLLLENGRAVVLGNPVAESVKPSVASDNQKAVQSVLGLFSKEK